MQMYFLTRLLPEGCPANHQLAAWPHGRYPLVWSDPTDPSQDTDLEERNSSAGIQTAPQLYHRNRLKLLD